jgi:homoserine kinase
VRKVKITLPASTTLPGNLGLALGLYTTIEMTERADDRFMVDTDGEGAGSYGLALHHPVALGLMRAFQEQEHAALGLHIHIHNQIPIASGLGAEAAFYVAGILGANNLLGGVYSRAQMLEMAARASSAPAQVVASFLGGLTTSLIQEGKLIQCALPIQQFQAVIALPDLPKYADSIARAVPERALLSDALNTMQRIPLLMEAFRKGDWKLLAPALEDRLHLPYLKPHLPGYDRAVEFASRAGAATTALCGEGPALIAFAPKEPLKVAAALEFAFQESGVKTRTWCVTVDTQGVVVSVAQSA